ncbi:HEAT repeat domain-containing protein [[Flexibacter] sp. ATCC 35103]|uniref:HEAT repeat domain-containing protein n=1 Tax=[Flexibacter] sp. ATCC 35103 TaxID=1937528 RepID=UPI0009CFAFDB|nr:HEAT repeat domain-containing protein [[Flexibacter] sp. ATCC 35103]OMQ07912.1 hypothetical protein BXU01_23050 [[Flexibacter] sp. ATCC 35103]
MNTTQSLQREYDALKKLDAVTQIEPTYEYTKKLLSSNDNEIIDFHYNLLKYKDIINLYNRIRASFSKRPKEFIEPFLLNKLETEKDLPLKADIIQLLGDIGSLYILPYAKLHIKSEIRDIRYRCIIVIGWVGSKEDLEVLNESLVNEPDDELRGYAATAMRQIWFKKKATSEDILPYLYSAVTKEESEETLSMIIIVIQDLLRIKFGLKEDINEGIIKGDVFKAKAKIIKNISKI